MKIQFLSYFKRGCCSFILFFWIWIWINVLKLVLVFQEASSTASYALYVLCITFCHQKYFTTVYLRSSLCMHRLCECSDSCRRAHRRFVPCGKLLSSSFVLSPPLSPRHIQQQHRPRQTGRVRQLSTRVMPLTFTSEYDSSHVILFIYEDCVK